MFVIKSKKEFMLSDVYTTNDRLFVGYSSRGIDFLQNENLFFPSLQEALVALDEIIHLSPDEDTGNLVVLLKENGRNHVITCEKLLPGRKGFFETVEGVKFNTSPYGVTIVDFVYLDPNRSIWNRECMVMVPKGFILSPVTLGYAIFFETALDLLINEAVGSKIKIICKNESDEFEILRKAKDVGMSIQVESRISPKILRGTREFIVKKL